MFGLKKKRLLPVLAFILVWFTGESQNYYIMGTKYYYADNDSMAIQYFDLAIKNNQSVANAYMMKGAAKISLGDYTGARSDLSRSLELDTNNAKAYFYYGRIFYLQKFHKSAIKYYNISIAKNNKDPDVYDDRAMCKFLDENYLEAIRDENEAIKLDPNNEDYYNTRGFCKLKAGKYTEALSDFETSLKIKPNAQAYANKGIALEELKEYEKAIACFSNSLTFIKDDAEVLYHRGVCHLKLGDEAKACHDLKSSLAMGYTTAREMLPKKCMEN